LRVALRIGGALVPALIAALPSLTLAAPRQAPAPRPPPKPLPAPPTIPLIRVEAARDHLLVTEDLFLGRGEWSTGDLDAFVSFGAPGVPRAVDARIYTGVEDDLDLAPAAPFETVPVERSFQRPSKARLLVGSSSMAGATLRIHDAAFSRATHATGVARVRVRTLLDLPAPDVRTGREVVVRLGSYDGEPYALGAIEVTSTEPKPWLTRAEAHLCGPDADPHPLAVRVRSATGARVSSPTAIAPVLSVRHPTDDLCVRFWTTSDP
jgi:hypothetical protein